MGTCTGRREGNYPWDDLDRRELEIERLIRDNGGLGLTFLGAGGHPPLMEWRKDVRGPRRVLAQVRTERVDDLIAAATAAKLEARLFDEAPYEISYSSRGRVWQVQRVEITLPPLWSSCGCPRCASPNRVRDGVCDCVTYGCWCVKYGHESAHEGGK